MAEENREIEIKKAEQENIEKVKTAINNLKNKKSTFLFFVAKTNNPSASIYEIYFHANVAKKMGYNVMMLTDADDYEKPYWIEDELLEVDHESMSSTKLKVGPQDILVIPEIFSSAMEQTKNLPCMRIGLLQSIDYMVNALVPSTDWSNFDIKRVITTSDTLKNMIEDYYGKNTFDIKTYNVGIPSYFKNDEKPKRPVITVVGRNPNEISKVIKLFYSKYPQFGWVTFDSMITDTKPPRSLTRKEYADRLRKNFASVWIDRISSFGTLPLEAMKSGNVVIGLIPDIIPEYLVEKTDDEQYDYVKNCGVWTNNLYELPNLIGQTIIKFLDDTINDEVYDTMQKIAEPYTQENSEKQLSDIYQSFIDERIKVLEDIINEYQKEQEAVQEK